MKKFLYVLFLILGTIFIFDTLFMLYSLYQSSSLIENTFTDDILIVNDNDMLSVLFIGDSLAAGVGASELNYSVYGRFANFLSQNFSVNFSNKAATGNRINDLTNLNSTLEYDLIVVLISSNDLFRFTSLISFEEDFTTFLSQVLEIGERIIIIGPGRVFETRALPFWSLPLYRFRSTKYSNIILSLVLDYHNVIYINPLEDLELNEYGQMEARDNFHPNDEGHRYWFDMVSLGWSKFN